MSKGGCGEGPSAADHGPGVREREGGHRISGSHVKSKASTPDG